MTYFPEGARTVARRPPPEKIPDQILAAEARKQLTEKDKFEDLEEDGEWRRE